MTTDMGTLSKWSRAKQTRKQYGATHTTAEIKQDVQRGGAEDPDALAATIRRDAIGQKTMTAHRKKSGAGCK